MIALPENADAAPPTVALSAMNFGAYPMVNALARLTARFYGDHVLVQATGLRDTVIHGGAGVMALSEEQFLAA